VAYGHEQDLIPQRSTMWPLIGVLLSLSALAWALRAWLRRDATSAKPDGPQGPTDRAATFAGSDRRA
jgi:hypothetical protein